MTDATAISATRRQYKEMADGTLRVSIDVDPCFKHEFLKLFPEIDMPIALAPLALDFEQPKEDEKPKGGPLSKSAAMLCETVPFQKFARAWFDDEFIAWDESLSYAGLACEMVYFRCGIKSRAELDHNQEAAKKFHEIMREYRQWSDLGETG